MAKIEVIFKERASVWLSNYIPGRRERGRKDVHKESLDSGVVYWVDDGGFNLDTFNP